MLDIKFIRENADLVKAGAAKKHINVDIDRLLALDESRRQLRAELARRYKSPRVPRKRNCSRRCGN